MEKSDEVTQRILEIVKKNGNLASLSDCYLPIKQLIETHYPSPIGIKKLRSNYKQYVKSREVKE